MDEEYEKYKKFKFAYDVLKGFPGGRIKNVDYYIYALVDPTNDEIRYIGQTNNPKKRLNNHLSDKQSYTFVPEKANWIFSLRENKLRPRMEIIETFKAPFEDGIIGERETRWIFHHFQKGANLTNVECLRMPRLFKAVRKSNVDFLTEPVSSKIWESLSILKQRDHVEWAEINRELWAESE